MNENVEIMINNETVRISQFTLQRIKQIALSRKIKIADAIAYCLEKVLKPQTKDI